MNATTSYRVRVLESDRSLLTQFPSSGYLDFEARVLEPFERWQRPKGEPTSSRSLISSES
jgi:hypothetical protein